MLLAGLFIMLLVIQSAVIFWMAAKCWNNYKHFSLQPKSWWARFIRATTLCAGFLAIASTVMLLPWAAVDHLAGISNAESWWLTMSFIGWIAGLYIAACLFVLAGAMKVWQVTTHQMKQREIRDANRERHKAELPAIKGPVAYNLDGDAVFKNIKRHRRLQRT